MELFNTISFSDFQHKKLNNLESYVAMIAGMDEIETEVAKTVKQFEYQPLKLDLVKYSKQILMMNVPIDFNRGEMSISGRKDIAVVQYTYELPHLSPNHKDLLKVQPSYYTGTIYKVQVENHDTHLQFAIPTLYATVELSDEVVKEVVQKRDEVLAAIQKNVDSINQNLIKFNQSITEATFDFISKRNDHLGKMRNIHSKL